jgi:hypothetical protein
VRTLEVPDQAIHKVGLLVGRYLTRPFGIATVGGDGDKLVAGAPLKEAAVGTPVVGRANFDQSQVAPKLKFRVQAEDPAAVAQIRLKVEINTSEIEAYDPPQAIPFRVDNPWFSGNAEIPTFSREEMLATKLRALLQRNKGRDLFDLAHSFDVFEGLNTVRVVECFGRYLQRSEVRISRAEAEQRMFAKLNNPGFLADMRPLLAAAEAERLTDDAMKAAFAKVFYRYVTLIPGDPWVRSDEMKERFGILP